MPLHRRNGEFFGTLCGLDPRPAKLTEAKLPLLQLLAQLLAFQLESHERDEKQEAALLDAQAAALLREQFIAVLGHDLRNPLNAIVMTNDLLLRREDLPPAYTRSLQRIATSAQRITRMVGDLMDFARGRLAGGVALHLQRDVDLAQILNQVVDELAVSFPRRTIQLVLEEPLKLDADPPRLAQMFSNLIANALQHSPEDTPVRVEARGGASLSVAIRNEGAPMQPSVIEHLFKPFRRGGTQGAEGLGLGLYIAQQIAGAHRGSIEAASDAERGTCFTVRLARSPDLGDELT